MNRLTFPCLSAVVCFLLLMAMLHVSFSHAWSASKTKKKREDREIYYSSHTICQCIFQQSFEKEPDFPEIFKFSLKSAKKKLSNSSAGRMPFLSQLVTFTGQKSTSLWRHLNGQTQCHKRHHWKRHHGKHTTCELWLHRALTSVHYSTFQWTWRFIEVQ